MGCELGESALIFFFVQLHFGTFRPKGWSNQGWMVKSSRNPRNFLETASVSHAECIFLPRFDPTKTMG